MTQIGLSTSLRSLVNSLDVNQTSLSYLSDNISNANTVGYTRKVVSQETQVSNGVVLGVAVAEIRRSIDEFLVSANREQISKLGQAEVRNDYYTRIQQFTLGNPNSSFTITNSLDNFYSRLDEFANDPSSAVKRSLVITAAQDFTSSIKSVADGIQSERLNADTEIDTEIDNLNTYLSNLDEINGSIRQNGLVGGNVERLLDARDVELDKIKELIDADFSFNEFGQVSISVSSLELLGISQFYEVSFSRLSSVEDLVSGAPTSSILITPIDENGNAKDNVETLLSASDDDTLVDNLPDGKLRGLVDLRDSEFPDILAQLDNYVYTFANEFNAIHNSGTGFPPPQSLTGTQAVSFSDELLFSGSSRITLTDANGRPLTNRYGDDLLPLEINFDEFNGAGNGSGTFTVQSFLDEINNYYGVQSSNSVNVGDAHDIKLASNSSSFDSVKATGNITFSGQPTAGESITINGIAFSFIANGGTPVGNQIEIGSNITGTIDNIVSTLNASTDASISVATYSQTNNFTLGIEHDTGGDGGNGFTVSTTAATGTASAATLTGGTDVSNTLELDFEYTNFNSAGDDITFAVSSYTVNGIAATASAISNTSAGGTRVRTNTEAGTNDSISIDLSAFNLEEGDSFTVEATIKVTDANGVESDEVVTYTINVPDPTVNTQNDRYSVTAISGTGDGETISSSNSNGFLTASLVDANGNPVLDDETQGYIQLTSAGENIRVSIDQLNSSHGGNTSSIGIADSSTATERGISHFFGLNNFFDVNDSVTNAANDLAIRSDIIDNPSFLSSGKAQVSTQTGSEAVYSYEIGSGSNKSALELIDLQNQNLTFSSAGGLPELRTNINSYITEIYNSVSIRANSAENSFDQQSLLSQALQNQISEVSGVNIDEELSLTIQIQNSYSASAKVISVVRELFDDLESALL